MPRAERNSDSERSDFGDYCPRPALLAGTACNGKLDPWSEMAGQFWPGCIDEPLARDAPAAPPRVKLLPRPAANVE
jgi:hypothetical protein